MAHLQGIARFSKEVVDKLALFGTKGSPEMMGEVLKAEGRRMEISGETAVRMKVSVQGWGDPVAIDQPGEKLEEVISVAQAVGAKFILEVVECFHSMVAESTHRILQMVVISEFR